MKSKLFVLVLSTAVLWTGCTNNSAELEGKIQETQQALTDTVTHFTDSIANLHFMMDSLSAELAKHSVQTRTGGSSRSTTPKTTTIPTPKKDPGTVNVTQKGGGGTGEEIKVNVTKKGGEGTGEEKVVNVKKKGGG